MFIGTYGSGGGRSDIGWKENLLSHSSSHDESGKPFLIADGAGGGGGGAPEPGLSGGSGGLGPPLWFSNPALEGSCGVAGNAREMLPFLFTGGGGGRGPDLLGGSLTGGGGRSFGGGGRGPDRPAPGKLGGAREPRERFLCGRRGMSSFPLEMGGTGGKPGLPGGRGGACETADGRGVEGTGGLLF